jgi:hypothetical protein
MAEIKIISAESSPCNHCGADVPMSREGWCDACNNPIPQRWNSADFLRAFFKGRIIDVRAGGLVLGRNHNEDDIKMVNMPANGVFQLCGVMMGGEYILSKEATAKHMDRLNEINAFSKDSEFTPLVSVPITEKARVFNTNGIKGRMWVYVDSGQFIVNRAATATYYQELEELNNSVSHELEDEVTPGVSEETADPDDAESTDPS